MRHPVLASLVAVLLMGCGPRFVGGSSASYGNADKQTTTQVVTQRDARGQLLFVIAWTAQGGGGSTSHSLDNLLKEIHGRPVNPSLERRAVYSLQTNGSLQEILLSPEQITALFGEMQTTNFHSSHSQLWQKEVAPKLNRVETGKGG